MASEIPSYIIIDNTDHNVTVVGVNTTQSLNQYEEYDGTDIPVIGENTQVIFSFWGTSVNEYQTMCSGVPNTLNFTLDDDTPTSVGQPVVAGQGPMVPHWMIYNATALANGPHTLISSIQRLGDTPDQGAASMIIDYFIVTRPAGDNVAGLTLLYDDAHPAFQYTGTWDPVIGPTNAVNAQTNTFLNMNWTVHAAVSEGATAKLNFNGSSIMVYGCIHEGTTGPIASFAIDSEPATTAGVPNPLPSPTLNVTANQVLYEHADLDPGTHSLIMTALGSNVFYFDYLIVTGADNTGGTISKPSSTSGNSASATSVAVITSTPTKNQNGPTASAHQTLSTGIIAATVIASVAVFSMIIGAVILFLRHRQRLKNRKRTQSVTPRAGGYTDMTSSPTCERFSPLPTSESLRAFVLSSESHRSANEFTVDDIVYLRPTKLRQNE